MKVLFIYPEFIKGCNYLPPQYYEGIACLSAVLKKNNHEVKLIHLVHDVNAEVFIQEIKDFSPGLIGFSALSNSFTEVKKYARIAKEYLKVPVICGGIHATVMPEEVISEKSIDFVCIGEGELPILELAKRLEGNEDTRGILNIWAKDGEAIYRNHCRKPIDNLNALPFPDRSIFDFNHLFSSQEGAASFYFSRGCIYNCSYCCSSTLRKNNIVPFRYKDAALLVSEIKETIEKYNYIRYISFGGDILPPDRHWLEEFTFHYTQKVNLLFSCNIHPLEVNRQTAGLLKKARCNCVNIGVETGDDDLLQGLLRRSITTREILARCRILDEAGIKIVTYNMVGLPFEDSKKILKTVKLNAEIKPARIRKSIFCPYPGSDSFKICRDMNLISQDTFGGHGAQTILNFPRKKKEEITFFHRYFRFIVKLYILSENFPHLVKLWDKLFISGRLPYRILTGYYDCILSIANFIYPKLLVKFFPRRVIYRVA